MTVYDNPLSNLALRRAYDSSGTLLASRTAWAPGTGLEFTDDATNKRTVISQSYGALSPHPPVVAATIANLSDLSSVTVASDFDGHTPSEGDRVAVIAQTNGDENGVYVVGAIAGGTAALTRATDWDESTDITAGASVYVQYGDTWARTVLQLVTTGTITIDTTAQVFEPLGHFTPTGIDTKYNLTYISPDESSRAQLPGEVRGAALDGTEVAADFCLKYRIQGDGAGNYDWNVGVGDIPDSVGLDGVTTRYVADFQLEVLGYTNGGTGTGKAHLHGTIYIDDSDEPQIYLSTGGMLSPSEEGLEISSITAIVNGTEGWTFRVVATGYSPKYLFKLTGTLWYCPA